MKSTCRALISAALFCATACIAYAAPSANVLMPVSTHMTVQTGELVFSSDFTACTNHPEDARLSGALTRFIARLSQQTDLDLPTPINCSSGRITLNIAVDGPGEPVQSINEDESYTLNVSAVSMSLHAATTVGALRGLETVLQLVQFDGGRWVVPMVHIEDAPRFAWRGLLVDVSRHFEPISEMERTIDGMSAVKLNVLHLHLTDDQGFRIESKRYPKLTSLGSEGKFYTQAEMRALVTYARDRGVRIVPEFDMPGHNTTWLIGYPQYGSRTSNQYAFDPTFVMDHAAFDPTSEATYAFLDNFLAEMGTIFTDAYVHIGGDETDGSEWKSNPHIAAYMKAHKMEKPAELQAYFNVRVQKLLARRGKKMLGWDEILSPQLPTDITVQTWHEPKYVPDTVAAGHPAIFSSKMYYYLDHMLTAEVMYSADPLPADAKLTPAQQKLVLGGEVCMWGEQVNERTLDSRIWPRSVAVAERLWSPADVRDVDDMYRRLGLESVRLERLGLSHLTAQTVALRSLAGSNDTVALTTLAGVTTPAEFHIRMRAERTTRTEPFTAFVDAIRPDPPSRRELAALVARFLKSHSDADREALLADFAEWASASDALTVQAKLNPTIATIATRSAELGKLAAIGSDAVHALALNTPQPADWGKFAQSTLQTAGKSKEMIEFAVLDPLAQLVAAAAPMPMSPATAPLTAK